MKLCSYAVVHDKGFAPNPFDGYCTLAVCTPNHQGLRLDPGHWLVGHSTAAAGNRLVYAMRVSEVLDFGEYFLDRRFDIKKARPDNWQTRCRDNIYFRDPSGELRQGTTFFHNDPESVKQDTRHPSVFISEHFFYFGENAPAIPSIYSALIRERWGSKCDYPLELVEGFIDWLERKYSPGVHGLPRDREADASCVPCEKSPNSPNPAARADC